MPLKLNGSSSGYVQIEAPAVAGNNTLTLPTASGTLMTTGGSNTFTSNQIISVTDNSNAALRITQLGTGNALVVEDSTNPDSTPFVVDASGNVGIGGASLGTRLEVYSSNFDVAKFASSGTNVDARINLDPRGTGIGTINSTFNALGFQVQGTEHLRIDSAGNVGIGSTSFFDGSRVEISSVGRGNNVNVMTLVAAGSGAVNQIVFRNANGAVGSIQTNVSTTTYATSSDYRLKEDIRPVANAVSRLMSISPVNFAWKADGSRVDGFIAHEVQEVIPEAVTGAKDAVDADGNPVYQGIDQSKLVPLLTAALQEALTKIDALEARIATLEAI